MDLMDSDDIDSAWHQAELDVEPFGDPKGDAERLAGWLAFQIHSHRDPDGS